MDTDYHMVCPEKSFSSGKRTQIIWRCARDQHREGDVSGDAPLTGVMDLARFEEQGHDACPPSTSHRRPISALRIGGSCHLRFVEAPATPNNLVSDQFLGALFNFWSDSDQTLIKL